MPMYVGYEIQCCTFAKYFNDFIMKFSYIEAGEIHHTNINKFDDNSNHNLDYYESCNCVVHHTLPECDSVNKTGTRNDVFTNGNNNSYFGMCFKGTNKNGKKRSISYSMRVRVKKKRKTMKFVIPANIERE